ncbi:MAG TPA: hypothetical protein VF003_14825 [Pseudonocardiaceae bacterium]
MDANLEGRFLSALAAGSEELGEQLPGGVLVFLPCAYVVLVSVAALWT